jgi:hypothetical protein
MSSALIAARGEAVVQAARLPLTERNLKGVTAPCTGRKCFLNERKYK